VGSHNCFVDSVECRVKGGRTLEGDRVEGKKTGQDRVKRDLSLRDQRPETRDTHTKLWSILEDLPEVP
jgi:hypothetical protein